MYVAAGALFLGSALADRGKTKKALLKGLKSIEAILPQLVVVLFLIAAMLAAFDARTISRFLGASSGWLGVALASLVGAVTLLPGFVAFPAAGELLRNGAGAFQIAAFVSSLMMVGIVTLPMEISYFGRRAAIARNAAAFVFSLAAAAFVSWAVSL